MAIERMRGVVQRLLLDAGETPDGDLLERYLALRDETAFAALVRRHGPMVLGVCRRVLRDPHDADDAFQATFLVLVRKAHAIFPRGQVGPWLHGVAYRTSLKAQTMNLRRKGKQKPLADVPGPAPAVEDEWLALLDREIQRLPEKYRLPVVLCDLEGKTRKQAARETGWPEGTIATRLHHGRALIQKRLARHGLPVSAGAMTLAWAESVSAAAVPAALFAGTVKTASLFGAGKVAGLIPLNILVLAQGVMHAMVINKVKNVSFVLIVVGLLGLGLGGLTHGARGTAGETQDESRPPIATTPQRTQAFSFVTGFVDSGTVARGSGRLPTGPTPVQALVSLAGNEVVVLTSQAYYEPKQVIDPIGRPVTTYVVRHAMQTTQFNRDQVEVYDTRRRKLDNKELPKLLKTEIPALLLVGTREIDPLHLRLIKEGTLIFVVPAQVVPVVGTEPGSLRVPQYAPPPTAPIPAGVSYSVPALGPLPLAVPATAPSAATANVPPPAVATEVRNQQADRDLRIAEFYLKAGKLGSADFYYELVRRRYAGTSYAKKAAALLEQLRSQQPPPTPAKAEARVGEIHIVGNQRVPDSLILENLPFYPGQVLNYADVRAGEEKLRALKEFVHASPIVSLQAKILVLEPERDPIYKDILITVQETLRLDVLNELKALNGSWTVTAASVDGTEVKAMLGHEFAFSGDQLTMATSQGKNRSSILVDPSAKPKTMRITPLEGSGKSSVGTYGIQGDVLTLTMSSATDSSAGSQPRYAMKVTLKRRGMESDQGKARTTEEGRGTSSAAIHWVDSTKGLAITAASISFHGNRVILTDATIERLPTYDGHPPTSLSGARILLTLDGPVSSLADLGKRSIGQISVDGASSSQGR